MANTLRVSIQPNNGATRVIRIAQPSLRVTISKGGGVALPAEKTFGAAKVYGSLVSGYASNGLPNSDTQAAINYALAQGYPAWSIIWRYQGEAVAGSVSSTATVPSFSAWATFTPPSVTATAVSEAVSASATIPALTALASFTAPAVTGQSGVTATATVPQFSAVSTFAAPTVYATRYAMATVPQFAASATFSAPNVTVTPAGATAASVTVPSFGAVATFAAPSVTAQGAATAPVPSFSAMASLSAPNVTGVVQALATVTVPQFAATSTFASPAVSAQRAATVAIPSLSATSTLTAPNVAATRVATASVPSFGATATFAAPTVTGVQQAAAVSATATVPSFTATTTFTAPSVAGTGGAAGPLSVSDSFNRANGGLGSNWTTCPSLGAPQIGTNTITASFNKGAYWSANPFADDQWSKASTSINAPMSSEGDALGAGPAIRVSGSGGYFACALNWDDGEGSSGFVVTLWRRDSSTFTKIGTNYTSPTLGEYYWLKITGTGNAIAVYGATAENGPYDQLITTTDVTTSGGSAGIIVAANGSWIDNWSAGDM